MFKKREKSTNVMSFGFYRAMTVSLSSSLSLSLQTVYDAQINSL